MRALECEVKKAEVQHLMQKYSKDDNNEIGQDEFMQISECLGLQEEDYLAIEGCPSCDERLWNAIYCT